MKNLFIKRPAVLFLACALGAVSLCAFHVRSDKLAPADLVAKHLDAVGPAEARAKIKGARIKGSCELTVKAGGAGISTGSVEMASQGNQNFVNMSFEGEPSTAFAFDGNKATVTQFRPGRHTALEHFFAEHQEIVREGLVGGVLSEAWPLLNVQQKNPKLEYLGLKKVGGKDLHTLRYSPRKGSELKITLFFDPENFRHVRTEYEQTVYSNERRLIGGGGGALPGATDQRSAEQRLNVFEAFSDFSVEGGLMLPHTYSFELSVTSQTRPILVGWIFNLKEFAFNSPIDASQFAVGPATTKENPD